MVGFKSQYLAPLEGSVEKNLSSEPTLPGVNLPSDSVVTPGGTPPMNYH